MGIWQKGKTYKLIVEGGEVRTATVEKEENGMLVYIDLKGINRAIRMDKIVESRELLGDGNESKG